MHFMVIMFLIILFVIGCALVIFYSKEYTSDDLVPLVLTGILSVVSIITLIDFWIRYLTN